MAAMAANPNFSAKPQTPETVGGARRSKVPLGPHLFMMAIKNSNQMKTHEKRKVFRGKESLPVSAVLGQASQRPRAWSRGWAVGLRRA